MQLGIEIFSIRSLSLQEGDTFSTAIQVNGFPILATAGRDEYTLQTILLPHKRLAATGRLCTYGTRDLICGLGTLQARPAGLMELPAIDSLHLHLETNRLLDYGELPLLLQLELHWLRLGRACSHQLSLHHPDLKIDWSERGTFDFDLSPICQDLLANIA